MTIGKIIEQALPKLKPGYYYNIHLNRIMLKKKSNGSTLFLRVPKQDKFGNNYFEEKSSSSIGFDAATDIQDLATGLKLVKWSITGKEVDPFSKTKQKEDSNEKTKPKRKKKIHRKRQFRLLQKST